MSIKKSKYETQISEEDHQFFREEVSDVRPLKSDKRIETVKKPHSPQPQRNQQLLNTENQTDSEMMSDPVDLGEVKIEDSLFFARSGIQQKVQRRLRRGELPIEDELDLHGYTVIEAKVALQNFIRECKLQHKRYVRIIHGKGYRSEQNVPILKTHVAHWLPQHADVLAYSSALPADGGTGALYIILKAVR
ncbi:MAG: Smr/MutS family endonuclease [Gammaproteobacteria bacterium]|nr:Smr/MutS family endonuclease [Gammaproteobacteria bacterium]MCW8988265.1 Smr/MutS family endonuclease [Gammaproteobacteria bacterium]